MFVQVIGFLSPWMHVRLGVERDRNCSLILLFVDNGEYICGQCKFICGQDGLKTMF